VRFVNTIMAHCDAGYRREETITSDHSDQRQATLPMAGCGSDGEVVDVFLQARRDGTAAKRFFKRLLRSHGGEPRKIVTDKLRSYGVAHRELMSDVIHDSSQYANNRAEQSHEPTRVRERGMRKFKSVRQAQKFLGVHAAVSNLFNIGRHLVRAEYYRNLRTSAFSEWSRAVA
jgi:putative transposase